MDIVKLVFYLYLVAFANAKDKNIGPSTSGTMSSTVAKYWSVTREKTDKLSIRIENLNLEPQDKLIIYDGRSSRSSSRTKYLFEQIGDSFRCIITESEDEHGVWNQVTIPFSIHLQRRRSSILLQAPNGPSSSAFAISYASYNRNAHLCDSTELFQHSDRVALRCSSKGIAPGEEYCDVHCPAAYYLQDGERAVCGENSWQNVPECALLPELVEVCESELMDETVANTCPYSEDELGRYYFTNFRDELDLSPSEDAGLARAQGCTRRGPWYKKHCAYVCSYNKRTHKRVGCRNARNRKICIFCLIHKCNSKGCFFS